MKLPSWIKARQTKVTDTHVHFTITADVKALTEEVRNELTEEVRNELLRQARRSGNRVFQ